RLAPPSPTMPRPQPKEGTMKRYGIAFINGAAFAVLGLLSGSPVLAQMQIETPQMQKEMNSPNTSTQSPATTTVSEQPTNTNTNGTPAPQPQTSMSPNGMHTPAQTDMTSSNIRQDFREMRSDYRDLSKDLKDVRQDVTKLSQDLAANADAATIAADMKALKA